MTAKPPSVLFKNLVSRDKLNPRYAVLATVPGFAPARNLLEQVFSKLPNPDGNFVKDFQTTGYDQRIWELYLFATFTIIDLEVDRPYDRPDFLVRTRKGIPIWVEATTANPTQGGQIIDSDSLEAKNEQVAIKLASPLFSKLSADPKYWELPHVAGNPLVFALADFHDPLPWRNPDNMLVKYLFGMTQRVISAPGERVEQELVPITQHSYAGKTIPSNFFGQPGATNVSAVMFVNSGTVTKFNRMEYSQKRYPLLRMIRYGTAYDWDPTSVFPLPFGYMVGEMEEAWTESLSLYHNPIAQRPIDKGDFPQLAHHWMASHRLESRLHTFHPFMSVTEVYAFPTIKKAIDGERQLRGRLRERVESIQNILDSIKSESWALVTRPQGA